MSYQQFDGTSLGPTLGVIIVNYNQTRHSLEAALSVAETAVQAGAIVIVDNGSGPGSSRDPQLIERIAQLGWRLESIALPYNVGFAGGVNTGLKHLGDSAEFILLLNPDVRAQPGSIAILLEDFALHPEAAAVSPMLTDAAGLPKRYDHGHEPTQFNQLLLRLNVLLKSKSYEGTNAAEVDWVSGAFMLVRGRALQSIGRFDEGFFLYFEDADWCRRARQIGWTIRYLPSATAVHFSRPLYAERWRRLLYQRSMRRYYLKHYGASATVRLAGGQQIYNLLIRGLLRARLTR